MNQIRIYLFIFLFVSILPTKALSEGWIITDVPFVSEMPGLPQEWYCAEAAFLSVKGYWYMQDTAVINNLPSLRQAWRDAGSPIYDGYNQGTLEVPTDFQTLANNTPNLDFVRHTGSEQSTIQFIEQQINNSYPVIIHAQEHMRTDRVNHFVVIVGYNNSQRLFFIRDNETSQANREGFGDFEEIRPYDTVLSSMAAASSNRNVILYRPDGNTTLETADSNNKYPVFDDVPLGELKIGEEMDDLDHWENSSWYFKHLYKAVKNGWVHGYIDSGSFDFGPNDPVTRAQALKIILEASGLKLKDTNEADGFSDVSSEDWFYFYVSNAVRLGVIDKPYYLNPYSKLFFPDNEIKREYVAELVARTGKAMGHSIPSSVSDVPFPDVPDTIDSKKIEYIQFCKDKINTHEAIMTGYKSGQFGYGKNLNRAEYVTIAGRLNEIK